jgi:hypothetical protein
MGGTSTKGRRTATGATVVRSRTAAGIGSAGWTALRIRGAAPSHCDVQKFIAVGQRSGAVHHVDARRRGKVGRPPRVSVFSFLTARGRGHYHEAMNGDPTKGIEDIVRRNVAALRSKANLTQQGLADEMLLRGIAWTR